MWLENDFWEKILWDLKGSNFLERWYEIVHVCLLVPGSFTSGCIQLQNTLQVWPGAPLFAGESTSEHGQSPSDRCWHSAVSCFLLVLWSGVPLIARRQQICKPGVDPVHPTFESLHLGELLGLRCSLCPWLPRRKQHQHYFRLSFFTWIENWANFPDDFVKYLWDFEIPNRHLQNFRRVHMAASSSKSDGAAKSASGPKKATTVTPAHRVAVQEAKVNLIKVRF